MLVEGVRVVLVCDQGPSFEPWVSLLTHLCNGSKPVVVSPSDATVDFLKKLNPHRVISLVPLIADFYLNLMEEVPILAGPEALVSFVGAFEGECSVVLPKSENYLMHDGVGLWTGFTQPLEVTGYPTKALVQSSIPNSLVVTAWNDEMVALAIRHRTLPLVALNFNPYELEEKFSVDLLLAFLEGTYLTGVPIGPPEI